MRNRPGARTGLVILTLACLLLLPAAIRAEEPAPDAPEASQEPKRGIFTDEAVSGLVTGGAGAAVDLLLVRPLSAAATAIGLALFVPAALLSLADYPDTFEEAWELFVLTPAKNVYERPLGDF